MVAKMFAKVFAKVFAMKFAKVFAKKFAKNFATPELQQKLLQNAVQQTITNINNLLNDLTSGKLENDLDPGREDWIKKIVDQLKQHEKQLEAQQTVAPADASSAAPPEKKKYAGMKELFPDRTREGVSLAF